jgi:hypothetical protein
VIRLAHQFVEEASNLKKNFNMTYTNFDSQHISDFPKNTYIHISPKFLEVSILLKNQVLIQDLLGLL